MTGAGGAEEWIPTVQLGITSFVGVATAWIAYLNVKAKNQREQTARRNEASAKRIENSACAIETQVGEITRAATGVRPHPQEGL